MYVKYRCNCITDTRTCGSLSVRCPEHKERIQDWASDYRTRYRVVIHLKDNVAHFALHEVDYNQMGFASHISRDPATPVYKTTSELAAQARRMGMDMETVSNIFYDRYLEYTEFYPESTSTTL